MGLAATDRANGNAARSLIQTYSLIGTPAREIVNVALPCGRAGRAPDQSQRSGYLRTAIACTS